MFSYAEFEIVNTFFKERRSKYKPAYALDTHNFQKCSCLYRDFSLVMEIWFKVMEKSWNPLVKMCKNPVLEFLRKSMGHTQVLWFHVPIFTHKLDSGTLFCIYQTRLYRKYCEYRKITRENDWKTFAPLVRLLMSANQKNPKNVLLEFQGPLLFSPSFTYLIFAGDLGKILSCSEPLGISGSE